MKKALVLGGGIQGCCIALMLKKHGYEVAIIEKSKDMLNRASLNQEGKIHLGFVYGLDASLKTSKKILLDALYFAPYLEYLLDEKVNWDQIKSSQFNYLVAKDSLLSSEQFEAYLQTLQSFYLECLENKKLTYLGKRPKRIYQKDSLPIQVNSDLFQSNFVTQEVAVHPLTLIKIIKNKILSSNISLYLNQCVMDASKTFKGYKVETYSQNDGKRILESDLVFNCLWEGKIDLDKKMELPVDCGYNYRLKFGIFTQPQAELQGLQSFTIVQGAFGDYVNYPSSNETYLSWYPSSMQGMLIDKQIPQSWEDACEGKLSQKLREDLLQEHFNQFQILIPKLLPFRNALVKGGVIVARGLQDINDRNSKLHERNEIPITNKDGYFSINTGKFTSAPHNTLLLEKRLRNEI